MNKTLSDFITEFRIEKAKELLKKDELKIYEISTLVGYQTSQYFSQVFKKMTGTYPSEYKDRVGG
ncbi:helix-turn-helix domain-containing protein [Paenibacillus alginolyticus]|uniref:helix-turn-helix domain-containing protein n=1 Tax=Paenibacillus alginolyticus TaxID=59839 RepID=UPI00041029FA